MLKGILAIIGRYIVYFFMVIAVAIWYPDVFFSPHYLVFVVFFTAIYIRHEWRAIKVKRAQSED